jgi:hypothetical protein
MLRASSVHILSSADNKFGGHQLLLYMPKPESQELKAFKKIMERFLPHWEAQLGCWLIDSSDEAASRLHHLVLAMWPDQVCTKCDFTDDCADVIQLREAVGQTRGKMISNMTADLRFSK